VRILAATAFLAAIPSASDLRAQPIPPPDSLLPPAAPHAFGVRDLWALERVSDPQPSPDGAWVVYVRRRYDVAANKSTANLWLVSSTGGAPRQLTTARSSDTSPRWSSDGRGLAFRSDRGGGAQVWSLDLRGGEPRSLTDLPVDVESFAWSPDGSALLCAVETYVDCPTLECTRERTKKLESNGVAVRRYDRLLFRHWDGWDSGRRRHLFVVPAAGGAPVDLTPGADLDAPPGPSGGSEEFAWSPDGRHVVFQARRHGTSASWTTNLDLFVVGQDGSNLRCITEQNLAVDEQPRWSPDGRTIAYLAMARPGYEADRRRVVLYDVKKAQRRVLTEAWDRSPADLIWSLDGKRLIASVQDEGRRQLYAIDASNGSVRKLPHAGSATSPAVHAGTGGVEKLVYLGESLTAPPEVYGSNADGSGAKPLTDTNSQVLSRARMSTPDSLWFAGEGGTRMHAWLTPPVDRPEGRKVPLVLLVHGGPQGSWDDRFHFRWNPQILAGAGYAVLCPDPRGSTGYGQIFTDGVNGDWGGKCYEDLMKAVDHVVATVPWVDSSRLAAAGGSFGGYMMYWMAGHTDRFRCLVSHAGLYDLESFWGTTEEQWFPEWEFGGTPWEENTSYARWSPSRFAQNWKTPILVTEGAKDYRVPEAQGFAAFTALQRRGVPSQLLWFSGENHHILKPQNAILWYDSVIGWFDRWLAPQAVAASPAGQ
jgi:dipeptidyl aminopeptidase/acylaminoacyl peptidase